MSLSSATHNKKKVFAMLCRLTHIYPSLHLAAIIGRSSTASDCGTRAEQMLAAIKLVNC